MFNFTALLGAQSSSPACQSILELDGGIEVLIDVGWDASFDASKLTELERRIPTLSFILLTHATTAHLGAFAHCCKHLPLFTRIPVYATTPVISLGRTLLQDIYASTPAASTVIHDSTLPESVYAYSLAQNGAKPDILLQPPSAEEISGYFSLINPLKYSQPHQPLASSFSPSFGGLTITAYGAGHTLGGTIWHIQHGMESIVYAVDWNLARETVLSGAAWLSSGATGGAEVIEQLRRPTAMICSSRGAESDGPKKKDAALISLIRKALNEGGSVLIPTDSSARVLELAYLLEGAWHDDSNADLRKAKLVLASKTCSATMRLARSMLEWMEEGIVREFETASASQTNTKSSSQHQHSNGTGRRAGNHAHRGSPFEFRNMRLVERPRKFERLLSSQEPKVILASDSSLEWGYSKEAIQTFADDPRNVIALTQRSNLDDRSLSGLLWNQWTSKADPRSTSATIVDMDGIDAAIEMIHTTPLEGQEMALYQQYLARQRQLQNTVQQDNATAVESSADVGDDRSSTTSSSSEDSDVEHQGKAMNISATMTNARHKLGLSDAELGINVLIRRKGVHDYDVRGKKGRERVFPFVARRKRGDDFGDLIRPEEYLRAEERDQIDGDDMRDGHPGKQNAVGQKRKWDDVGTSKNGIDKRSKSIDSQIAAALYGAQTQSTEQAANGEVSSGEDSDQEAADEANLGPVKMTKTKRSIKLRCRLSFVDFSGLHDRRSLQMLIPLIRPRKLILVAGNESETSTLADDCRQLLSVGDNGAPDGEIFTPGPLQVVDASVDTNAWTVKLSKSLVKRIQWQKVGALGVVTITGQLNATSIDSEDAQEGQLKKMKTVKGSSNTSPEKSAEEQNPVLDVLPANLASATRSASQPLHVGDMRLVDLQKLMQASGYTAEFRGMGTLLVNGMVAVRKSGSKIEVEGVGYNTTTVGHEGTFFAVRRKIYEGLAVVAGR